MELSAWRSWQGAPNEGAVGSSIKDTRYDMYVSYEQQVRGTSTGILLECGDSREYNFRRLCW